jgi:hypothetical protein
MRFLAHLSAAALAASLTPVAAQPTEVVEYSADWALVGVGRLFTNDVIGDRQDRWRTGSYVASFLYAPNADDDWADHWFENYEVRLRSEIVAPAKMNGPSSNDRAYAGILSIGLHSHTIVSGYELSYGADLIATGPSTGMIDLQEFFHDVFSAPSVGSNVRDNQLGDALYPALTAEIGRTVEIGEDATLRPFVEAQFGFEDMVRIGADLQFGLPGSDLIRGRDVVTGQRYNLGESDYAGYSILVGADYAWVSDSVLFPASFGTEAMDTRYRARVGVNWQVGDQISTFAGFTYLSEEYVGQPEGQVVGSVKINLNF